jgi:hypothetical protein
MAAVSRPKAHPEKAESGVRENRFVSPSRTTHQIQIVARARFFPQRRRSFPTAARALIHLCVGLDANYGSKVTFATGDSAIVASGKPDPYAPNRSTADTAAQAMMNPAVDSKGLVPCLTPRPCAIVDRHLARGGL